MKLADDRSGDVVIRLYESRGGRAAATVSTGFELTSAAVVDLLERPLPTPAVDGFEVDTGVDTGGGQIRFQLRPFQIATIRLNHR